MLPTKLWQIIHGLADKNTYLHSINHLDDRALYAWLWREGLSDNIMSAAGLTDSGVHLDILGSGDEESKNIGLIYYDSAQVRANWHASFPNDTIPAHRDPICDRDRHLPQRES